MKLRLTFSLLILSACLCFCHSRESAHAAPDTKVKASDSDPAESYDLTKVVNRWELPATLKEVSGNTWVDANHLLVIEDLHPHLYLLRLDNGKGIIEKDIPFAADKKRKFDIEDVTRVNNTAYALWSHGTIYKIDDWQTTPKVQELPTFLTKENNTEGICYDPESGNLLVACKNESDAQDEKKSTRAVYSFDTRSNQLLQEPFLLIHKKDFEKAEGEKIDFYPSAIAVHPKTHDIYILSTKGTKCLAQYGRNGKLKNFQYLDKAELPQPEGICFSPEGTMYISSEGRHGEPAVVCQFAYQQR
jgi:uncharacterized protein YjiK